jgi:hypothetical protein
VATIAGRRHGGKRMIEIPPAPIGMSPVQRGQNARKAYVNELSERGILLSRASRRVEFKTRSGKIVGMPWAEEKLSKPKRWFLGLPDQHFDFVILLCQSSDGKLMDFVFPSDFVSEIWDSLPLQSQDGINQRKFDVKIRKDEYELKVNGRAGYRIQRFLENVAVLTG